MRVLKCPRCGFTGRAEEFIFIQEVTLQYTSKGIQLEERERPLTVVCPRCGEGFPLEPPYAKLLEKINR